MFICQFTKTIILGGYYEEKKLFTPKRTEGNTRLFSFNDIDKLLTIKDLLTKGFSLKAIDEIINEKEVPAETTQIRQIIKDEIDDPSEELVKFILGKGVYNRAKTQAVIEKYTPIVKNAFDYIMYVITAQKNSYQ